jgi:hypothetical protein
MRGSGRGARITETPEGPKTIVGRWDTEEELMRGIVPARATGSDVEKEGGGGESVRPEAGRDVRVEQQCADAVIKSADDAFGAAILLRRIRTSETEDSAVRREEVADSSVVKFLSVVSLKCDNGATKLSGDIGVEGSESGEDVRLTTKRECPYVMREIIQND